MCAEGGRGGAVRPGRGQAGRAGRQGSLQWPLGDAAQAGPQQAVPDE